MFIIKVKDHKGSKMRLIMKNSHISANMQRIIAFFGIAVGFGSFCDFGRFYDFGWLIVILIAFCGFCRFAILVVHKILGVLRC